MLTTQAGSGRSRVAKCSRARLGDAWPNTRSSGTTTGSAFFRRCRTRSLHRGDRGCAQLFTENTLYPVVLALDRRNRVDASSVDASSAADAMQYESARRVRVFSRTGTARL